MSPFVTSMLNYIINTNANHTSNNFCSLPIFPTFALAICSTNQQQVKQSESNKSSSSSSSRVDGSHLTLTTSSSSTSMTTGPGVLNFSRIIDLFYNNEPTDNNTSTRNRSSSGNSGRIYSNLPSTTTTTHDEVEIKEFTTLRRPSTDSSSSQQPHDESQETNSTLPQPRIQVIDWHMLDKWKFYPLSMLSSFTIRCCLYPFTVVKTCIQLQQRNTVYTSMLDAYRKIYAAEGFGGLYKGFWVSTFQIVSGVGYVSTYEGVRHLLKTNSIIDNNNIRALIAGGCASVVGQTFLVPFDVISQHLMVLGKSIGSSNSVGVGGPKPNNQTLVLNPLNINYEGRSKFQITKDITKEIYRRDGLRGYYKGYFASLGTYVPNSALWWSFYHIYQVELAKVVPLNTPHLIVQCFAATLGGFTTTILTNPLDVCRARLQVQRLDSFPKTFSILWAEERLAIFTKGLSARLTQSAVFSFAIILGYETIKRFSVKENYKDEIKW